MQQQFLVYRVFSPFVGRLRLESVVWIPRYPIGNAWLLCMSHNQPLSYCPTSPLSPPRSRNWLCPRCEKSNLECLPDPALGGSNAQTVVPDPPQTIPEAEVKQPEKDDASDTTVFASSPSPPPQDPPEEPPAATTPIVSQTAITIRSPVGNPRPPLLLDTAICVLLVLALSLLFRRFT